MVSRRKSRYGVCTECVKVESELKFQKDLKKGVGQYRATVAFGKFLSAITLHPLSHLDE
jgi:hypothetical protein